MPVPGSARPAVSPDPSAPAWRVPGALWMLTTVSVGRLPQAMGVLALVRLVRDDGGSYGLVGIVTAAFVLGSTLGQPMLGRWVDRAGTARALPTTAGLGVLGLLAAVLSGAGHPTLLAAAAGLAGLATPPLESTLRSLWPKTMADGAQLNGAFGLDLAAQELLYVLAPLLASAGLLLFGARGTVLVMSLLLAGGTLAFAWHPVPRRLARTRQSSRRPRPLRSPSLRALLAVMFLIGLPVGTMAVIASAWAELHGVPGSSGLLMAINGLGGFLGTVWIGRRPPRTALTTALRAIVLGFALLYLAVSLTWLPLPWYATAAGLAGIGFPMALTQVFHLVARVSAQEVANEANAWAVTSVNVGIAAGTWASGAVIGVLGAGAGTTATVLGAAAAAALSAVLVPRGLGYRVRD